MEQSNQNNYIQYFQKLEKYMNEIIELHNHTLTTLKTHLTHSQNVGMIKKGIDKSQTDLYLSEIERTNSILNDTISEREKIQKDMESLLLCFNEYEKTYIQLSDYLKNNTNELCEISCIQMKEILDIYKTMNPMNNPVMNNNTNKTNNNQPLSNNTNNNSIITNNQNTPKQVTNNLKENSIIQQDQQQGNEEEHSFENETIEIPKTHLSDDQKWRMIQDNIKEWTRKDIGEVIFDSNVDDWEKRTSVFDKNILGKSRLLFLIDTYDEITLGGYINTKVNHIGEWISDPSSFVFTFKDNIPIAFPIKQSNCKEALFVCKDRHPYLFKLGTEIEVAKRRKPSNCEIKSDTSFEYGKNRNPLIGKKKTFKNKRIRVFQMLEKK